MRIYDIIDKATMEIVGYTKVYDCDIPDTEVLNCRIEIAIEDGLIPDVEYYCDKGSAKYCFGVLI